MKLGNYTFILVCPETDKQVSDHKYSYSSGVCHHCGHIADSTFTHAVRIAGRWNTPSILEWLCGKRAEFKAVKLYDPK